MFYIEKIKIKENISRLFAQKSTRIIINKSANALLFNLSLNDSFIRELVGTAFDLVPLDTPIKPLFILTRNVKTTFKTHDIV